MHPDSLLQPKDRKDIDRAVHPLIVAAHLLHFQQPPFPFMLPSAAKTGKNWEKNLLGEQNLSDNCGAKKSNR
jgi:hypothetical protein